MCAHGHPHISSRNRSRRHPAVHAHVSPILTRLLCGKPFGSGAQFSVALAPSLPNFQVTVPPVPVYVSIALQEEDLRATGWNPMPHQKKCTQVRINSAVWISLQGRVRFFQPVHGPWWCYDLLSRKDDTHKSRSIVSPRTFFLRGVWY